MSITDYYIQRIEVKVEIAMILIIEDIKISMEINNIIDHIHIHQTQPISIQEVVVVIEDTDNTIMTDITITITTMITIIDIIVTNDITTTTTQ